MLWGYRADVIRQRGREGLSWSPAEHVIEYEINGQDAVGYHREHTKYSGPPSDERDKAWSELVRHRSAFINTCITLISSILAVFFNASRQELERAGEYSEDVAELEEGGYLVGLTVYYELHCLVRTNSSNFDMLTDQRDLTSRLEIPMLVAMPVNYLRLY
ncbi:hypothetical protein F4779DRAFT_604480 [Xylariaceae sp. FL0662B]|nr:hypothetical protein F4779DRAFT_604480 [Xylariaceae sp. FL0662B]